MKIELKTVALTANVVRQLPTANLHQLGTFAVLGWFSLRPAYAKTSKAVILLYDHTSNDAVLFPMFKELETKEQNIGGNINLTTTTDSGHWFFETPDGQTANILTHVKAAALKKGQIILI